MINNAEAMGVVESGSDEREFHEMLDRQILEYRRVVGYHRLEMSIEEGRVINWPEAEREVSAAIRRKSGHQAAA
ncbi:hypothetical protein [Pontiella agarivorans]|uniref:Uncharacterized protein n=1 Tax=Pontiella agarivorans TaxID=3038953 RepID=A0ABU5N1N3_9BACT|nr:hypothetical protein [Pontiella agarivorans]MDZ8120369.1 hypothetical protein [Pontiella agarivorans]